MRSLGSAVVLIAAVVAMPGCRDDLVLTVKAPRDTESVVKETLAVKPGVDYELWADYRFTPAKGESGKYCYYHVVDVVLDGKTVATTKCELFPTSDCITSMGNAEKECKTVCAFEVAEAGEAELTVRLERGEACDSAFSGLNKPSQQISKYNLVVEADD